MKQSELIQELKSYVQNHLEFAESLLLESSQKLNHHPEKGSWNALQCIEHLNRYGGFYLQECGSKVKKGKADPKDRAFKGGFFGKLFTSMMLPKKGMIKMKTFADKNPDEKEVKPEVIKTFIAQQKNWLEILENAKSVNLNKNNCHLTLPLLKMNLGSTLKFNLFHNERHVVQATKALDTY